MTTPKPFLRVGNSVIAISHISNVYIDHDNGRPCGIEVSLDGSMESLLISEPLEIDAFMMYLNANSDIPRVAKSSTDSIAHAVLLIDALRKQDSYYPIDDEAMGRGIAAVEGALETQHAIDPHDAHCVDTDMVAEPLRRLVNLATPLRDFDDNVRDVLDIIAS